jgi:hypothetical protein
MMNMGVVCGYREMAGCLVIGWLKASQMTYTYDLPSLLGVQNFYSGEPAVGTENSVSNSELVPDFCISSHKRFPAFTENIRKRHGRTVTEIRAPVFNDVYTTATEVRMDSDAAAFRLPLDVRIWSHHCGCMMD